MKYLLIILTTLSAFIAFTQKKHFPIVSKGKWGVIDSSGQIIIQPIYNYLSPFNHGVSVFKKEQKYGLINTREEIITEGKYHDIINLNKQHKGQFLYQTINNKQGIINESGKEIVPLKYADLKLVDSIYIGKVDSNSYNIGTLNQGMLFSKHADSIHYLKSGLFKSFENKQQALFTINGKELIRDTTLFVKTIHGGFQIFLSEHKMLLFDLNHQQIIDTSYTYFGTKNQFILLKDSLNQNISYSLTLKRFFKNWNGINISRYKSYYIVKNNQKYGVLDSNLNEVLPIEYTSINFRDKSFYAYTYGKIALFDDNFNLIMPPLYQNIIKTKFGYIYSQYNSWGVLNKNGNKITNAKFEYIDYNNTPINCHLPNGGVVQLIFDEKWNFITKKEFKKFLILKSRRNISPNNRNNSNQFGWFEDSIIATKKDGTKVTVKKWGIKNEIDSIVTPPIYREYEIINDTISYGYRGKKQLKKSEKQINNIPVGAAYNIINHISGERLVRQPVYQFHIKDFENNNLARALTNKGITIYNRNFSPVLKNIHFANAPQEGMLLFSEYNKDKRDKSNVEGQVDKLIAWQQYATGISLSKEAKSEYFRLLRAGENTNPYITPHIKFGYLNSITEEEIFPTQFDKATNFYQGVAFVGVQNKKTERMQYGIVRKDSLFVPIKYDNVDFLYPNIYDSLYIVTSNNGKQLYFDSLLNPKNMDLKNMKRVQKDVIIATQDNKTGIVNDKLQWKLEPTYRKILVAQNNELVSKNRLHGAISTDGELLFEPVIKKKYIIPLQYGAKIYQNRNHTGKIGYYHYQYGELFKPFKGKVYESEQVILKVENSILTYYKNGKELKTNKLFKYTLLMENDSISISKRRNKTLIFNKNSEEKIKLKEFTPTDLKDEGIYYIKNSAMGLTNYNGETQTQPFTNTNLTPLNDSIFLTENDYSKFKDKRYGLINKKGKQLIPNDYLSIEEVFEGVYLCLSKHQPIENIFNGIYSSYSNRTPSILINAKGDTLKAVNCTNYETTSEGLVLLKNRNSAQFIDSTLTNPFSYQFFDAQPFVDGIATVRTRKGWQVMNRKGELISIPSFYSMQPIANNTIVAKEKPKKGVYNYKGEVIVPVEFEEINPVSPTIIQVIKEGKAGYISTKGNWIYNPF